MIVYGDEDRLEADGVRSKPRFKPAWNRELFWSDPQYSNHWFVRGDLWNSFFEHLKSQNWWNIQYSLLAYADAANPHQSIAHIPLVLTHSVEPFPQAQAASLQSSLHEQFPSLTPEVIRTTHGFHLQWASASSTLISVIIPTRDHLSLLCACLQLL